MIDLKYLKQKLFEKFHMDITLGFSKDEVIFFYRGNEFAKITKDLLESQNNDFVDNLINELENRVKHLK